MEDQYLAFSEHPISLQDEDFRVRVHWAVVNGRAQVVGLDLRSFYLPGEAEALQKAAAEECFPLGWEWAEVKPSTVREFKLGEVIEDSRAARTEELAEAMRGSAEHLAARQSVSAALRNASTRGAKPVHDPEVLRDVVAPAHLGGGRKPVVAVRLALQESGALPGVGPNGEVTHGQAKRAVELAKRAGYIPTTSETKGKKK